MNITEWRFHAHYVNVWSADLELLSTSCQKECKAIQDIEKYQTTKPNTYRRVDGKMKMNIMISTSHNCYNEQTMSIYVFLNLFLININWIIKM